MKPFNALRRQLPLVAALLLTLASPALAQSWVGTAAVEVEVTERGKPPSMPIEIQVQFLDSEPKAGPPAAALGADGITAFGGLAEGRWLIDIRARGKSAYSAVLQVEAGKKATVVAGPVRDAAAPSLNIKFSRPSGRATAARSLPETQPAPAQRSSAPAPAEPKPQPAEPRPTPAPERPAPPPAPAPEPRPTAPRPVQEKPATERPAAAPTVPAQPAENPASKPAATPPAVSPPSPAPAPGPQPTAAQPAPASPAPAPPAAAPAKPAAPEPKPVPTSPLTGQPAPAPAPSPSPSPVAPSPSPTVASASPPPPPAPERGFAAGSIRSQKDGTCPECKAGEWSVSAQVATGPAGRAADCALEAPFKNRLAGIAAEGSPAFGRFVGPLVDPVSGRWVAIAGGGEPLSPPGTSCQLLAVVLPKGARYKGYVYEVGEAGRNGSCVADGECEVGKAHWSGHPGIEKVGDATVIWGLFTNLSSDRERRAKLVVYFSHPDPGWKPPAL